MINRVIQWTGTHFQGYTGSTWVDLDYTSAAAGGWTDGGSSITLTTTDDLVGIGAAADANYKVLIYGNADKGSLYLVQTLSGAAVHPVLGVTSVWDVGTNTPTLINYVLTDSASGAASKLMEFIVGGSSKFALRKDGQLTLAGGLIATTGAFSGSLSANPLPLLPELLRDTS